MLISRSSLLYNILISRSILLRYIHLSISLSKTCNLFSSFKITAHVSQAYPYKTPDKTCVAVSEHHCVFNCRRRLWRKEVIRVLMKTSALHGIPWTVEGERRHWTGVQSPHKNFTFLSRSSSSPTSAGWSSWLVAPHRGSNGSSLCTLHVQNGGLHSCTTKVIRWVSFWSAPSSDPVKGHRLYQTSGWLAGRPPLALTNIHSTPIPSLLKWSQGCTSTKQMNIRSGMWRPAVLYGIQPFLFAYPQI
jgi:hypothetical protein